MSKRKIDPFNSLIILALGGLLFWLVIILGKSPIGFAWGAEPQTVPLKVHLPEPGYRQADGSLLSFADFSGTKVMYGTCDSRTEIGELLGEVSVKSWGFVSPVFRVPVNTEICIVAVVLDLERQPIGRSTVAKFFEAVAPGKPVPQTPRSLKIAEGT